MRLENQVAIVTGAGRNIGEETAKLFAQEGAAVAVVDMDRARADKVTDAITAVFQTDLALKSSAGDPRVLLERLVVELCGPSARPRVGARGR